MIIRMHILGLFFAFILVFHGRQIFSTKENTMKNRVDFKHLEGRNRLIVGHTNAHAFRTYTNHRVQTLSHCRNLPYLYLFI